MLYAGDATNMISNSHDDTIGIPCNIRTTAESTKPNWEHKIKKSLFLERGDYSARENGVPGILTRPFIV